MIKKLWVKFDNNLDIECICDYNRKRCPAEKKPECKEYVVKFIEIERSEDIEKYTQALKDADCAQTEFTKKLKGFETELQKSIKKLKGFKI